MIGIDPDSEGLASARANSAWRPAHEGVDWLLARDEMPDMVFEATSAYVHAAAAPRYAEAGIRADRPDAGGRRPGGDPAGQPARASATRRTSTWSPAAARPPSRSSTRCRACGRACPTPRSSRRWRRCRPARAPAPTSTSSPRPPAGAWRPSAAPQRGKAIIILNPADPPMIMRDTIFCAIPEDADHDAIAAVDPRRGGRGADLRARLPAAQRAAVRRAVGGSTAARRVVTTFVEVEGAGDYLPPYAGNLDIMTAAATKVGEEIAKEMSSDSRGRHTMTDSPSGTSGSPTRRCATGRTTSATSSPRTRCGAIVAALDAAGVPVIEVTHGDGLGGSSFNYGFSKTPEQELIKLAAETAKEAKIAFLMLPGVGTKDDIKEAQNNGGSICRIATHCTEADVSIQHFGLARELGLETVGFLMMSHTIPPEKLAEQARIMADAGLPVRLRRRLGRCAGARRGRRPGRGAGRRARRRRAGRFPRPREPRPGRRQLGRGGARRCQADRRQCAGASAPAPATRRSRR